mmetsp:Transcript_38960/g.91511  ORF Transcript_38960/g.91511 Transcript_38960/m.91511 type:complete len:127 (-) Transcript_38960:293-673(-)
MKKLKRWGLDEAAYGESSGFNICRDFEGVIASANGGKGLEHGNYVNGPETSVASLKKDGRMDGGMDLARLTCHSCGILSKDGKLRMCSLCHQARYCNQYCQRAHWRAGHKQICNAAVAAAAALEGE